MKHLFIIILFQLFINLNLEGQEKRGLTGDWVGKRQQYNATKRGYQEDFKYKYSLTQINDRVIGVVYIIKSNGDYAELAVKGHVADNIFYFQEYEILNAKRSTDFKWCLKTGILYIDSIAPNEYILRGQTQSTMEFYNTECTGGYTTLKRKEVHIGEGVMQNEADLDEPDLNNHIEVYPNPFSNKTHVKINLPKANNCYIDVIDINGTTMSVLQSGSFLQAGTYTFPFEILGQIHSPQFYYLRVKLGYKTYTRILQRQ